jgi:hypothetical protein
MVQQWRTQLDLLTNAYMAWCSDGPPNYDETSAGPSWDLMTVDIFSKLSISFVGCVYNLLQTAALGLSAINPPSNM